MLRILPLTVLVFIAIGSIYLPLEGAENHDELIQKIAQQASENESNIRNYGYDVTMNIRSLNRKGDAKKTETRNYRTLWNQEKPRLELHQINNRPLNEKQKKEEAQNKKEWQKSVQNGNNSQRIPFSWHELLQKYDFTIDSNDHSEAYVLLFKHKKTKLPVRNRIEKVLNHLDGTMWVDREYRIVRLQAGLNDDVGFGFGLAKVTNLDFDYTQMPYGDSMLPASLHLNLKVKALFIYSETREISTTFTNYCLNPAQQPTASPVALEASASK